MTSAIRQMRPCQKSAPKFAVPPARSALFVHNRGESVKHCGSKAVISVFLRCGAGGSRSCQLVFRWCLPCCSSVLFFVFGVGGRRVRSCVPSARCFRSSFSFGSVSAWCCFRCSPCFSSCGGRCSSASLVRVPVRRRRRFCLRRCVELVFGVGGAVLLLVFPPSVRPRSCSVLLPLSSLAVRALSCFSGSTANF